MKSILIIGMGRFGHHLAKNFLEHEHDVSVALIITTAFAFLTTSSVRRLPKRLISSLFNTIATA